MKSPLGRENRGEADTSLSFLDVFACTAGILIILLIIVTLLARSEVPPDLSDCWNTMRSESRVVERMEKEIKEFEEKATMVEWYEKNKNVLLTQTAQIEALKRQKQMKDLEQQEWQKERERANATASQLKASVQLVRGSVLREENEDRAGIISLLSGRRARVVRWTSWDIESDDYYVNKSFWDSSIDLVPRGRGTEINTLIQRLENGEVFDKSIGKKIDLVIGKTADMATLRNFKRLRQTLLSKGWKVGLVVLEDGDSVLTIGRGGERPLVQ